MRNNLILLFVLLALVGTLACQKPNNTNSAPAPNPTATPMPPGISTSPLPQGATPPPGIPDPNAPKNNNQPSGPIPGIPDPKAQKTGKTPPLSEKTTPSKGSVTQPKRRP